MIFLCKLPFLHFIFFRHQSYFSFQEIDKLYNILITVLKFTSSKNYLKLVFLNFLYIYLLKIILYKDLNRRKEILKRNKIWFFITYHCICIWKQVSAIISLDSEHTVWKVNNARKLDGFLCPLANSSVWVRWETPVIYLLCPIINNLLFLITN